MVVYKVSSTPYTHLVMSEHSGTEATASQSGSTTPAAPAAASAGASASADRGDAAADPLASGEAIDEMLAANDPPGPHNKRKYPDPGFDVERSGGQGKRGSYTIRFKLKAAAFTRAICPDGQPVGNNGAAKVLKVDRKRIISWVREEEEMKGKVDANPAVGRAKSISTNPITAAAKEVEAKLMPPSGDGDSGVELLEQDDSDVELLDGPTVAGVEVHEP